MAHAVFTAPFFSVGGTDLSSHVRAATLDYEADGVDDTSGGDTTHIFLGGLKNWTMEIDFGQDFAASQVDATLFSVIGTTAALILRPVNTGGVGATNPNYTGTGLLQKYSIIGQSQGELAVARLSVLPAGNLSRATS